MSIRIALGLATAALLTTNSAQAETPLEQGFAGALRGCEEWVLNPTSWVSGPAPFIAAVGLGDKMGPVAEVNEVNLAPPNMRVANHYWRINSTAGAGFVLVVSDRLPMCHITGGGDVDLQPAVEAVLGGSVFTSRWEKVSGETRDGMRTTVFRNRSEPAFSMVVSRATSSGARLDRVQVLATATFEISK